MSNTTELLDKIVNFNKNPSSIQQHSLDMLEQVLDGKDIVDATNPFMFLLEASATGTAAAIAAGESITRKLYPKLANSEAELYIHMSDKDVLGAFATPSKGVLHLLIPLVELQSYAINDGGSARVIVIPKDTKFTTNGVSMGIHYPIRIELLPGDVIQTIYDLKVNNVLDERTSNIVDSQIVKLFDVKYLELIIPVEQFNVISKSFVLDGASGYRQSIPFDDQYYHAKVFTDTGNNTWDPIATTLNQLAFDINKATAILEVIDNTLYVSIPIIYQTNGLIGSAIRIEIYTTKGKETLDLSGINAELFSANWRSLDNYDNNPLYTPLNSMNDMVIYGDGQLTGGSDKRNLEELREQIIYRTNSGATPIREGSIDIGLRPLGYSVQKLTDNITDRSYVASKDLPLRERDGLSSPVKAANIDVIFDESTGLINGTHHGSILTNTRDRITITPNALYLMKNNTIRILSNVEKDAIEQLTPADLVTYGNSNALMYSPFHYIVDYTTDTLDTRVYHMSNPKVVGRSYEDSNVGYSITTKTINITLVNNSYVITVLASTPNAQTNVVHAQLRYKADSLSNSYYLNGVGTVNGNETTFIFTLDTTFDITIDGNIEVSNLSNISSAVVPVFINIHNTTDLFYMVESDLGNSSNFDDKFNSGMIGNTVVGATHESFTVNFGTKLNRIYVPSRNVIQNTEYQTYQTAVQATYPENVYQNGTYGKDYSTNPDGSVNFIKLYSKDELMFDVGGDPVLLHSIGDLILDTNGDPIPVEGSSASLLRQVGITLVNGLYTLGNSRSVLEYRNSIPETIISYLDNEIRIAADKLHERTELYYRPKGVLEQTMVTVGDSTKLLTSTDINFNIVFYLTSLGLSKSDAVEAIRVSARKILSEFIGLSTISTADILARFNSINPEFIKGIDMDRFVDNKFSIISLSDPSYTFSIPENLKLLPDGNIDVVDNVNIIFKVDK